MADVAPNSNRNSAGINHVCGYSSGSVCRSTDTALPKRRLRERLSPEAAESIQYPPAPRIVSPLFQYPYTLRDDEADLASAIRNSENGSRAGKSETGADDEANRESRAGGSGPGG